MKSIISAVAAALLLTSGAAFAAVGLATVQSGGTLDDFTPGIDFFGKLNDAGNFIPVNATGATIASAITAPSLAIRPASHSGTRPPWSGRSALPARRVMPQR